MRNEYSQALNTDKKKIIIWVLLLSILQDVLVQKEEIRIKFQRLLSSFEINNDIHLTLITRSKPPFPP